ncbi:serine--tRNA ligase [Deinococcus radiodurans]|jgi:seryl-tRNA synthetase (EC 6.1.1.11)|uniref:Serine--tRNA ligase n=1 Tax=Deinococcus radiodurans (strain ATCC 13939 / DSM 20539 / JCM 16871 / CCUG 27074 / LMG 4051 / NBRC 15346 / NCIMB 9279 / VKM B-1422 / R1) TaxID=243230 RepID=SYS_DEIRA|nr:serine--tRNA ligase [Deinococcus radiodurans]Q9RUV5.1 RecName: Full=Serine--tRNA ligase; AltName: Full=Seryl-tRNA synthetase; Short=SerRS; AltName: Full=Seryl-tRNA(Ser/Sec) synthetase [Deinococcus radiodurans R1 = ATCC 13939 = DSM 20539]AAF10848.1 seryl-tRNA synthetase [Deinococcus radiodurans R1 = ATCC 13939 = DSM 20539]ANC71564.1 serine--tRNA ligase [Deinococcus radiodurans R1 = ATCC 13939 = DSM 20539]QEM70748.1 serine--tRNA ligase [Deinococcus radiodurans]QIP29328.1 serine--tRNA ligase [
MLDLKFIRENPDAVREAIRVKNVALDLDDLLQRDRDLVALKQRVEAMQTERNANAKLVPKASPEDRPGLIQKGKDLSEDLKALEPQLREQEDALKQLLLRVPNIPLPGVPVGKDEDDNVELRREGELPGFDFTPLDQVEILEKQGWADFERVARVSGSRSYLLKGDAALLEMAVLMFALDFLSQRGFTPLSTTALVRRETLVNSGHFPGDEESVYKLEGDELLLAGTAEVPINSLYAGEQLSADELPLTFAGFSAAFRREAGSAGRDVRGLIRVHEFRKVEQYVLCRADQEEGLKWFERLLSNAEGLLQALELPYRVIQNCTGDMGAGKVLMYDIETWVPSEQKYRETHSCSYLGDWQARRTGLRYRDEHGKLLYAHTLNNTGIASPRILVPLLENHQQADGTVRVPAALRPYLGGREVLGQPVR